MDQSLWTLSYQTSGIGIIPTLKILDFLAFRVETFRLKMFHLWHAVINGFLYLSNIILMALYYF